jgi:hypothetical protein
MLHGQFPPEPTQRQMYPKDWPITISAVGPLSVKTAARRAVSAVHVRICHSGCVIANSLAHVSTPKDGSADYLQSMSTCKRQTGGDVFISPNWAQMARQACMEASQGSR